MDKQGRKLPRPTTLNNEYSIINRMWKEVALTEGFISRDQSHEIPYAKSPKDQSWSRQGQGERSTAHQELSLWREQGERDQTFTSREAAAGASADVVAGNEALYGKRNPYWFSSQDEMAAHQRKQNPQQGGSTDLVSCGRTCRKHQDRTLVSVICTHRTTPGKTKKTDSPQEQTRPSLQESKH